MLSNRPSIFFTGYDCVKTILTSTKNPKKWEGGIEVVKVALPFTVDKLHRWHSLDLEGILLLSNITYDIIFLCVKKYRVAPKK